MISSSRHGDDEILHCLVKSLRKQYNIATIPKTFKALVSRRRKKAKAMGKAILSTDTTAREATVHALPAAAYYTTTTLLAKVDE